MQSTGRDHDTQIERMIAILRSEKAPYVVTLFLGALGFAGIQATERYNKGPTLEYSVEKTAVLGEVVAAEASASAASTPMIFLTTLPSFTQAGYIFSIENISSTYTVKCVRFDLVLLPRAGGPSPTVSNWLTSTSATAPVKRFGAEAMERPGVTALDIQPGGFIEIRMNAANVGEISVLPSACNGEGRTVGAPTAELPTVLPRSFGTVLAKHAMTVFWFALAFGGVVLAGLLFTRLKSQLSSGEA